MGKKKTNRVEDWGGCVIFPLCLDNFRTILQIVRNLLLVEYRALLSLNLCITNKKLCLTHPSADTYMDHQSYFY